MILDKLFAFIDRLSPGLRKVIVNTTWLFADKILQLGVGLLVGLWVARYLQPERFGLLNYAMATAGLFAPIASLGLNSIVIRDLSRDSSNKEEILGTVFVLKNIGSLIALWLTVGTVILLNPTEPYTQLLVGIAAFVSLFQPFETIDFWFQSQVQSKYTVMSGNFAYLTMSIVKVILINLRASLIAFSWVIATESALRALGSVIVYQVNGNQILRWKFSRKLAVQLLQQSWPMILSDFMIFIYMQIDQIMMKQLSSAEELGLYAAAVKVSGLWYFVPMAIVGSVFPSIVKAKDIGETVYNDRLQKLLYLMAVISYAVAIPVTLLAEPIVNILYGKNYLGAAPSLAVLIWAGLFVCLGIARSTWLITEGLLNLSAATTAVGGVVNVILNFVLIPRYGGLGAGIATLIAQMAASYLAHAFYPQTRKMFWMQTKAIFMIGIIKEIRQFLSTK